ncbi:Alpha/Beta hydrolase protein [Xylariomycetidae sp. FL0641]|nr:Alpha/Beta hydrolase protein [Xylariomycetidae sp. FL0641]
MKTTLAALAVLLPATALAGPSAGCGTTPPASGAATMTVNGKTRGYTLRVPAGYDAATPHRLVLAYHWLDGTMADVVDLGYYGLADLADEAAVFVAPDGLDRGWANAAGEDVLFTDMLLESLMGSLCVDDEQVFATGFSYGGAMSFSMACSRPDVFRAVAVISGAQLSGCDGGAAPVPYLGIHGVADSVLPIDLGRGLRDRFLDLNGCAARTAEEPAAGSGTHVKTEYACQDGLPVWWIAHDGDHTATPRDADGTYWAPGETWRFFTEAVA